jgi:sugar phosphate isomerase/epimerase
VNSIFLSTGTFIGRLNRHNYKLLTEYADQLHCDGFEFLIYQAFNDNIDEIISEYRQNGINIPVVHSDKRIGDLLSSEEDSGKALELFKHNADIALRLGAKKMVVHCWGIPDSDLRYQQIYERIGKLLEAAKSMGIDFLVENVFCAHHSPLKHLESLSRMYYNIGFIIDTRHAEFHRELESTAKSFIWRNNVRHIHISDYKGGYMDWDARYPIPQPTNGQIDWEMFFGSVRQHGYKGTVTLEAPAMRETGVDTETLNRSLDFIRKMITK